MLNVFPIFDFYSSFFLHPDLRNHPTGLACVEPLVHAVNALRSLGVKIIWVYVHSFNSEFLSPSLRAMTQTLCLFTFFCHGIRNDLIRNWGLTDHEITTLPPSLLRGFTKGGRGGFGSILPGKFGRLLMRDEYNSALYGPLQPLYEEGKEKGTDVWIHKNRSVSQLPSTRVFPHKLPGYITLCLHLTRYLFLMVFVICRMSGIWGPQTSLDLYLQENGITSLFFAGVNADQVRGTIQFQGPCALPPPKRRCSRNTRSCY